MRYVQWLRLWLRALVHRDRLEDEVNRELRFHIERETELNVALGMSRDDARHAALVAFGGVEQTKEALRDERRTRWLEELIGDLRFALRSFRRRRAVAVVAILTIALSIGATTAIYAVVDSVLFRSIPARGAGELVAVWQTIPDWRNQPILASNWNHVVIDYRDFRYWRARQTSFSSVAAWTGRGATLWTGGRPEQVLLTRASPSLLTVLGAVPALGRFFLPGEDVYEGPKVVVLSYDAWQSRYGGRSDVIGRTMLLDSVRYEIVGVLPKDFALARGVAPRPFFVPSGQFASDENRGNHSYRAIGRLSPGVSMERAATEAQQLLAGDTERPARGIRLVDYQTDQSSHVRSPLLLLLASAATLLLIATLNIATLLLGEATTREHEMSARVALGASRARLLRQMLTESGLLAALGASIGIVLALWMIKGLVALAPPNLPGIQLARLDGRVLAATTIITVTAGLSFGIAPALSLSTVSPSDLLRAGRNVTRRRLRLPALLMTLQVALSLVLLLSAGLVSRSLRALSQVDRGFRSDDVAVVRIAFPSSSVNTLEARHARMEAILSRLAAVPGVIGASGASALPFDGATMTSRIELPGDSALGSIAPKREANRRSVLPNTFAILGIPLVAGRAFTATDRAGAPLVMIVSEALARREWPTESALGKQVKLGRWWTVVGIVGDTKVNRLTDRVEPTMYMPYAQEDADVEFAVKTKGDPVRLARAIRAAIADVSPLSEVTSIERMDDMVRASMAEERFRTTLIDVFGAMAIILTAIGLYGLTSRMVARRTRESGIRIALGATPASVRQLILRRTMSIVAAGALLGIGLAVPVTQALASYLFGIRPADPATYLVTTMLLTVVALIASALPARRIGRLSPTTVLRAE